MPPRTDFTSDPARREDSRGARAVEKLCREKFGLEMTEVELFAASATSATRARKSPTAT